MEPIKPSLWLGVQTVLLVMLAACTPTPLQVKSEEVSATACADTIPVLDPGHYDMNIKQAGFTCPG